MRRPFTAALAGIAGILLLTAVTAPAQQREVKIGYQPNPISDASIAILEKWAAKNNVKLVKIPNAYGVYVEKMTASLTSGSDQYDVIWHNDDWGQLWKKLLEPTDDIPSMKFADKWGMDPIIWNNDDGKVTTVPFAHTFRSEERRVGKECRL